jgi:hypothetical protein
MRTSFTLTLNPGLSDRTLVVRLSNLDQPLMLSCRSGASAAAEPPPAPRAAGPMLSTLPGLFCWLLFASAVMPRELPVLERVTGLFGTASAGGLVLTAWLVAAVTSAVALVYYGRRPQLWHTTLCLGLHLAGLLFSALLLGGLVLWMVF